MGGSIYSSASFEETSREMSAKPIQEVFNQRKMHPSMNPRGLVLREARDSEAHPNSIPIIIGLDVTGSMGYIPEHIIKGSLGTIVETIIAAGIPDPAIMFVAIGDHISDIAPLQVGQFESGDKELVMWLERTWLEGSGGATIQESYLLAWYLAAFHTATDAWDKRKHKGILITIGDEQTHEHLGHLEEIFGGQSGTSFSAQELLDLAREKWNVHHIHADDGSYPIKYAGGNIVMEHWKGLLGQNVSVVPNHTEIGAKIAQIVISSVKEQEYNYRAGVDPYDFKLKKADEVIIDKSKPSNQYPNESPKML